MQRSSGTTRSEERSADASLTIRKRGKLLRKQAPHVPILGEGTPPACRVASVRPPSSEENFMLRDNGKPIFVSAARLPRGRNVFGLHELEQAVVCPLSAQPTLLHATERSSGVRYQAAVQSDHAAFK